MSKTSAQNVRSAFTRWTTAMAKGGWNVEGWYLMEGSATYGRPFSVKTDGEYLSNVINIGVSKSEAFDTLHAMAHIAEAFNARNA